MTQIRPWQIFKAISAPAADRVIQLKLPERQDIRALESCLLIAAMKLARAHRIFEFGTFRGSTTFTLALNAPADAEIYTFDLHSPTGVPQLSTDAELTRQHFETTPDFAGTPAASKITQLTGNSHTADFSRFAGSVDLIFVDGGHDYDTVRTDTENALKMRAPGGIIAWHDYACGAVGYGVDRYLDEMSGQLSLVHVADTLLVFSGIPYMNA